MNRREMLKGTLAGTAVLATGGLALTKSEDLNTFLKNRVLRWKRELDIGPKHHIAMISEDSQRTDLGWYPARFEDIKKGDLFYLVHEDEVGALYKKQISRAVSTPFLDTPGVHGVQVDLL